MGRVSGNADGDLARVLRWGTATGDGDDRLLDRFRSGRDESAFVALVTRHGPMVLGVCRRILRDEHDVEDAFQATFLVLVRSPGAIRRGERIGPWLHGVARRVALRARAGSARRFVHERNGVDVDLLAAATDGRNAEHAELRAVLDAELARLPETFRAPLVLCHLEGLTHEQAAGRLRLPVGTIRSRLSRGRERLRARLARRGVSADDAVWGSLVLAEPISTRLLETTAQAVLDSTVPSNVAAALASASAVSLAKGVLDAMLIAKLKLAGACALGVVLTIGGASGYAIRQGAEGEREPGKLPPRAGAAAPAPSPAGPSTPDATRRVDPALKVLERRKEELQHQQERIEAEIRTTMMSVAAMEKRRAEVGTELQEVEKELKAVNKVVRRPLEEPVPGGNELPRADAPPEPNAPSRPLSFIQGGKIVIVASPDGRVVTGYSSETGEARSIRLAEPAEPDLEISPLLNNVVGALVMRGPAVHRIAVFNSIDGRWHAQELETPATKAVPVVGGTGLVFYTLGNRVHAFSALAARWDVLELPEGEEPKPALGAEIVTCQAGDHLHVFSIKTGKWTSLDTRVVSNQPEADQGRAAIPVDSVADPVDPTRRQTDQKAPEDALNRPEYLDPSHPIVVPSPDGHVVTIIGVRKPHGIGAMGGPTSPYAVFPAEPVEEGPGDSGKPYSNPLPVRLAEDGDPRLEVVPLFSEGAITLVLRGEKIHRLAIFNMYVRRWDVQELREPVKAADPVSDGVMTTYALGRRLYTYSTQAGKWSVLELPEGAAPEGRTGGSQGLTLRYGDKIHIYNVQTGEWTGFDVQAASSGSNEAGKE